MNTDFTKMGSRRKKIFYLRLKGKLLYELSVMTELNKELVPIDLMFQKQCPVNSLSYLHLFNN